MKRIFAIGDIHGCHETFGKLLLDEIQLRKSDEIYCVGDYIDRGPDSKGVVDLILELRKAGHRIHTLRGNHEQLMMESDLSPENFEHWCENGGDKTLKSFQTRRYADMNPMYKDFFARTKYVIEKGKYIFVHAGLDFRDEDIFENKEAMLWIRDFEVDDQKLGDRMLIHGHSPRTAETIFAQTGNVRNIDGGCVYPHRPGYGYLFALEVRSGELIAVKNVDV